MSVVATGSAGMRLAACAGLLALMAGAWPRAQAPSTGAAEAPARAGRIVIPYAEARPVMLALRADLLPSDLASLDDEGRATAWAAWAEAHDARIRARLNQGDDDSVLTFLLFGTSFTRQPRYAFPTLGPGPAAASTPAAVSRTVDAILSSASVQGRVADLVGRLAKPGGDERVVFVRQVLARHGIAADQAVLARRHLLDGLRRLLEEYTGFFAAGTLPSTRFRDRGLSSDTSLHAAFAVDQALESLAGAGVLPRGAAGHVAVVGPGLDFTDKQEGLDIYPVQTIQPFAAIDSVVRLGLAPAGTVRVTTFDINPRVTRHIAEARDRAARGSAYTVHLPRDGDRPWSDGLATYWERMGQRIGTPASMPAPSALGTRVRLRAVRIPPPVVQTISPRDLNIVLERPAPWPDAARADLVIATNVLIYYDLFEQSLALAGIAHLLKPGGILLTNTPLFVLPGVPMTLGGEVEVPLGGGVSDWVQWYRRE